MMKQSNFFYRIAVFIISNAITVCVMAIRLLRSIWNYLEAPIAISFGIYFEINRLLKGQEDSISNVIVYAKRVRIRLIFVTLLFWAWVGYVCRHCFWICEIVIAVIIVIAMAAMAFPAYLDLWKALVDKDRERVIAHNLGRNAARIGLRSNPYKPGTHEYNDYDKAFYSYVDSAPKP